VIFETDHRSNTSALVATAHFASTASRVFSILNDPTSWGQKRIPRVTSATSPSKVVLTFDGVERATIQISSWSTDLCQMEVVLDGFSDDSSRAELEAYWAEVFEMLNTRVGKGSFVIASSPGKVNVFFAVGAFLKDGFHEVASCYQGLSLREKVAVEMAGSFSIQFAGPFAAQSKEIVPTDARNLVYKAGLELKELGAKISPELISFTIHKSVPIAGGMAGGSADGAAALVALNELMDTGLEANLPEAASKLGSDVPFSLAGGTAIGLGRGEKISPIETSAVLHWVMTPSSEGLSTPDVYRKLDILRVEGGVDVSSIEQPYVPEELVAALVSGNVYEVAEYMHNDLEVAAIALRPELATIIEAGRKAGALKSMVSGSGPTIAHLARDRVHAEQIVNRLGVSGFNSIATHTSLHGTRLEN
jgi:4-diphosphocytidyl-2-C-methyl-D-erythritol kinase